MKHQLAYICLLLVYTLSLIRPLWPLVDYALQQQYYAEVLCINQSMPEMHCNGQCILMQRLQTAAKEEMPDPFVPSGIQYGEETPELPIAWEEWPSFSLAYFVHYTFSDFLPEEVIPVPMFPPPECEMG